jgi:hypothetical protein
MITRLPEWRSALVAEVDAYRRRPFLWGSSDCALFAADCVRAMTGTDLAASYRGRYGSRAEADALIAASGLNDLAGIIATMLPEIEPHRARIGDVACIATDAGIAVGIFNGGTIVVMRPDGAGTLPFRSAARAFRV